MKMKILSAALLASLGVAGSAQAVYVNSDGTGQVLLYPYYTVENGYETYVSVVNTTNVTKAVKVRFLEGMNSQEVLDFNLYLSPHDEWVGKIFKTATGAAIMTPDTSCIAGNALPAESAGGQPFVNYQYSTDTINNGPDRAREGYLELIEMGVVTDATLVKAIAHVGPMGARAPFDCPAVRTAAKTGGSLNNGIGIITGPTGGLYGYSSYIAVGSGLRTTVDAVALGDFYGELSGPHHTAPGSLLPTLSDVGTDGVLISNGRTTLFTPDGTRSQTVDSVSAVLMRSAIMNDYIVDAGRNSSTNWVVTFPTKRFYVNRTIGQALTPFAQDWDPRLTESCDPIKVDYWDREEDTTSVKEGDFSPLPPGNPGLNLCHEVNTVSINRNDVGSANTLFGASFTNYAIQLDPGYDLGWLHMTFTGDVDDSGTNYDAGVAKLPDNQRNTLFGLPVIGFAAFTSENVVGGGLSNYMGSTVHKAEAPESAGQIK